jgi:hypothetical protein
LTHGCARYITCWTYPAKLWGAVPIVRDGQLGGDPDLGAQHFGGAALVPNDDPSVWINSFGQEMTTPVESGLAGMDGKRPPVVLRAEVAGRLRGYDFK